MNEELKKGSSVFLIELDKIEVNPYQPRIEFNQDKLEALAQSIKQYGILQPIVVSRKEEYSEEFGIRTKYQIIAGERRFRASKIAGLKQIPAVIRDQKDTDAEKLELAIIENLQREDLNPVDKARAFKKLADDFGLKHNQIAKKMGKSREYVSNAMRILMLPEQILTGLIAGKITEGHTRSLLMLKDRPDEQAELYKRIINDKLTVRAAEKLARGIATDKIRKKIDIDPEIKKIEDDIREKLGTKVSIDQKPIGDGGKLTIEYFNKEDLKKILAVIENNDLKDIPVQNDIDNSESDEEINHFDDIQPTVFKEELGKLDQFENVDDQTKKDNSFVGFTIGNNSKEDESSKIIKEDGETIPENDSELIKKEVKIENKDIPEKDFIVNNQEEKNVNASEADFNNKIKEGESVVDTYNQPVLEKETIAKPIFQEDKEKQIKKQDEVKEHGKIQNKINNFTKEGIFKKFGFGTKKTITEDKKNMSNKVEEINSKPLESTPKINNKLNNFNSDDLDQNSDNKNDNVIDGLEKIQIKNDFDKSRIDALKKTDNILGSFGQKTNKEQEEIDKLLKNISSSNLEKYEKNSVEESNSGNNKEIISDKKVDKSVSNNNNYSNLYNDFLKSKNEVEEKNKKQTQKKIEDLRKTNKDDSVELVTTGFTEFGEKKVKDALQNNQSKIIEENGMNVEKKEQEDMYKQDIKADVISTGGEFVPNTNISHKENDSQISNQVVNNDDGEDLNLEKEDDKYTFKGFSL